MALPRSILDEPTYQPAIPKVKNGKTADIEAIDEQKVIDANWQRVKKAVYERDKGRCRLCGKRCSYGARKIAERADPHHIIFASKGRIDHTSNVLILDRGCHDLVHKVKRFYLSGNADDRDPMGKGCVKVERQVESGFEVVGLI